MRPLCARLLSTRCCRITAPPRVPPVQAAISSGLVSAVLKEEAPGTSNLYLLAAGEVRLNSRQVFGPGRTVSANCGPCIVAVRCHAREHERVHALEC